MSFQMAVECTCCCIGMPPSCVNSEGACSCHVSEICDVYVKDGTNCVCVEMIYAYRKCSDGHMAGFIVCVLMICARRKCIKIHMAGFLGRILCTSAYMCIFICSVV